MFSNLSLHRGLSLFVVVSHPPSPLSSLLDRSCRLRFVHLSYGDILTGFSSGLCLRWGPEVFSASFGLVNYPAAPFTTAVHFLHHVGLVHTCTCICVRWHALLLAHVYTTLSSSTMSEQRPHCYCDLYLSVVCGFICGVRRGQLDGKNIVCCC